MSDLIDRQKTIKEFCKQDCDCHPKDCLNKTCYEVEIIESVPSVQPQWIPVSERLPEKRQDVIVTVNDGMIYTDTDEWIGTGFFAYGHNVVAWQSLPEPWKGEEE